MYHVRQKAATETKMEQMDNGLKEKDVKDQKDLKERTKGLFYKALIAGNLYVLLVLYVLFL